MKVEALKQEAVKQEVVKQEVVKETPTETKSEPIVEVEATPVIE